MPLPFLWDKIIYFASIWCSAHWFLARHVAEWLEICTAFIVINSFAFSVFSSLLIYCGVYLSSVNVVFLSLLVINYFFVQKGFLPFVWTAMGIAEATHALILSKACKTSMINYLVTSFCPCKLPTWHCNLLYKVENSQAHHTLSKTYESWNYLVFTIDKILL